MSGEIPSNGIPENSLVKENNKSSIPRSTKASRGRELLAKIKKCEQEEHLNVMTLKNKNTMVQQNQVSVGAAKFNAQGKSCKSVVHIQSNNKFTVVKSQDIDTCKVFNTEHPFEDTNDKDHMRSQLVNYKFRIKDLEKQVADLESQLEESTNKLEISESKTSYMDKKIEEIQDTYFNKWFTISTQSCETEKKFNKTVIQYESQLVEKKILNERLEKEVDALQEKITNLERKYYVQTTSVLHGLSMAEISNIVAEKDNEITQLNKKIDYLEKKVRALKIEARIQRIEARKHGLEPGVTRSNEHNCFKTEELCKVSENPGIKKADSYSNHNGIHIKEEAD